MTDPSSRVAVAIHDRRRFVRHGLRALLASEPHVDVVATAGTIDEAEIRFAVNPDVILVGDCNPQVERDVVQRFHEAFPKSEILSVRDDVFAQRDDGEWLDALRTSAVEREERSTDVDSPSLTPRERQVLSAVARGLTAREIAESLGISTRTVEHHKRRLYGKLGVQSQAHAVALVAELDET